MTAHHMPYSEAQWLEHPRTGVRMLVGSNPVGESDLFSFSHARDKQNTVTYYSMTELHEHLPSLHLLLIRSWSFFMDCGPYEICIYYTLLQRYDNIKTVKLEKKQISYIH